MIFLRRRRYLRAEGTVAFWRLCSDLRSVNGFFSFVGFVAGPKEFFFKGHYYFFTGHRLELKDKKFDWLDGRNICREYCMDLVSLETQEENNLIFRLIQQSKILMFTSTHCVSDWSFDSLKS